LPTITITITITQTITNAMLPSNPVFLITGAASGFGEAIAYEALSRGHHVIATARSVSKLGALEAAGAAVLDLDVTSDDATLAAVFEKARAIHRRITHVVNCAGYVLEGTVEEAR
jgi:NADP-dependent 3-hydroxy acid dehydrogenase YdfG